MQPRTVTNALFYWSACERSN